MLELSPLGKLVSSFVAAIIIVLLTALYIGEEKKAQWFRKRTKYSWFLRRGILGEIFHFGYPCKLEGYLVVLLMFLLICIISFLIVTYL